jgi:hypothetical protein
VAGTVGALPVSRAVSGFPGRRGGLFTDEDVVAGELGEGVSVGGGGEAGVEELALVGEGGDEISVPGLGLPRFSGQVSTAVDSV